MRIGIDLDEVVVDFARKFIDKAKKNFGKEVSYENIYSWHLWDVFGISREEAIKIAEDIFQEDLENLEFVEDARDTIINLLKENEIFIITSRPIKFYERTKRFVEKSIDSRIGVFFSGGVADSGKTKSEICKELGIDLMIDDHIGYYNDCVNKNIKTLLFTKPWNKNEKGVERINSWKEIPEIIEKMKKEIEDAWN